MITTPSTSAWNGDANNDLIGLVSSFLGPAVVAPTDAQRIISESESKTSSSVDGEDLAVDYSVECNHRRLPARVIIFSKDRPWQLHQLFRSFKLAGRGSNQNQYRILLRTLDIYVIVRSSTPLFHRGYHHSLMKEYDNMATFLIENDQSEENSFSYLLQQALTLDGGEHNSTDDGILMFLTDDCLLLEPLEKILVCAAGAIATNPHVFNFISRLHQGITWSQTRGVACSPPWNGLRYHSLSGYLRDLSNEDKDAIYHEGVYLYNRKGCSGEWSYPFDLSGGIYRHNYVLTLLSYMDAEQRCHPNILEVRANQLIQAADANGSEYAHLSEAQKPLSALPTRPLLVILAINRVQDLYQAPLATPKNRLIDTVQDGVTDRTSDTLTAAPSYPEFLTPSDPVSLLDLLDTDCQLDIDRYKSNVYNSTHSGDFFIQSTRSDECEQIFYSSSEPIYPKISVLIPVHRGPPDAASHCIASVIMQPIEEYHEFCSTWEGDTSCIQNAYQNKTHLSPMQIVIVDDRCHDGSIDAMIRLCLDVLKSHERDISFVIRDLRMEGATDLNTSISRNKCISICLDVIKSPKDGIACALNHGLSYCNADFVARMDADDICTPRRLSTQIKFMRTNPEFAVVGTSIVLFSAKTDSKNCSGLTLPYARLMQNMTPCSILRPSLLISDPGFLAWTMHFSCTVSHPSVVFRKEAIQELAGYDESVSCCEDYDLWLRLQGRNVRSVISLPYLGLWHRKHHQSSSSLNTLRQKCEAEEACHRAIQRLFHSANDFAPLDIEHVRILRNPSSARSSSSLNSAAKHLAKLESSFLQMNSEHLTEREIGMVNLDCSARIREIATTLATKLSGGSISHLSDCFAWKLWHDRCPHEELERLSLLCQVNNMK